MVTDAYINACDIVFNWLAGVIAIIMLVMVALGYLSIGLFLSTAAGSLFYALALLAPSHTLYHLTDSTLKKRLLFRVGAVWRVFKWLQLYHEAHHYKACNYSLILPIDLMFGSYYSPRKFENDLAAGSVKKENLFPGFTTSMSNCVTPLLAK